jgi:hypothetical protein
LRKELVGERHPRELPLSLSIFFNFFDIFSSSCVLS